MARKVPTRKGRVFDRQCGADVVGARPFHADLGDPCPDCGAWHGIRPLANVLPGVPCGHDRTRPCIICGNPVGDLSIAGSEICGSCAEGAEPPARESSQPDGPTESVPASRQRPNQASVLPFAPRSRQIDRRLAFAAMFALGAAAAYGVTAYGPRWGPMIAEWVRPTQRILDSRIVPVDVRGGVDHLGSGQTNSGASNDAETRGPGQSEATSPAPSVRMPTVSDRASASVATESADADRANVNARHSPPADSAVAPEQSKRSPAQPLPSSAQGVQPARRDARLRQQFEQFLNERQQASSGPQERETLFGEFKKLIESKNAQANGLAVDDPPISAGSSRRVETWQALDTTNLRELPSAASTAIGEVAKGSTFRVIGRSDDSKWLKIETRDGLTGYYWAARAREIR